MHFFARQRCYLSRLVTTTRDQMPPLFQEFNIFTGYRLLHQPWRYYWFSCVQLHNETMNVWTHLGGGVFMALQMWSMIEEFGGHPHLHPNLSIAAVFTLASLVVHFVSSLAHLLHNKSELVHCCLFFCDNGAASLIAFALGCMCFCFQSSANYYVWMQKYFLGVHIVGALILSLCYSLALARYRRRYNIATVLLMFGPTTGYMLWCELPFLHKTYQYFTTGGLMDGLTSAEYFQWHHFCHLSIFVLSAVFYLSYFPERFWPGQFDIWGHSHQWFHVFASLCHIVHLRAIAQDMRNNHAYLYHKRGSLLSVGDVAMALYTVLLANTAIFLYLRHSFSYSHSSEEHGCNRRRQTALEERHHITPQNVHSNLDN